jgi:hypothetical protein
MGRRAKGRRPVRRWETSGAHFYGWDEPRLFFSADIYTCKPFSVDRTVAYTRDFFAATASPTGSSSQVRRAGPDGVMARGYGRALAR